MGFWTMLGLAAGLSMDAFAVSVVNGLCCRATPWKNALACGISFGFFQALMPLIGYIAGHSFSGVIERFDHWIALMLLAFIGGKMIWESLRDAALPYTGGDAMRPFSLQKLGLQAIATSIDALAVGVWLGLMQADILRFCGVVGPTTFLFCAAGVLIGRRFGRFFHKKAEILGGVILILIGVHIFLEHTVFAV